MLAVLVAAVAFASPAAWAQDQDSVPTVGIRLVDAPTDRADDPRARQYVIDHVAPGTTIERRIEINNDTDAALDVQLYAGASTIDHGNFEFGEGHAANELTTWTSIDPATVRPQPGEAVIAEVTIAVPADASPGERYAVVWAELPAATPPQGGVAAVNRVGVRVYLSVGEGGEPASDFEVTALTGQRDDDGNPVVAARVENTGGRALDLTGQLRLSEGPGGLAAGPFDANLGTTLGIGESEEVLVVLDEAVPAGPWDAGIVLRSGTMEREAHATITFPDEGSSAPAPVVTDRSGGFPWLAVAGGVVALLLLVVAWRRRRRRTIELGVAVGSIA